MTTSGAQGTSAGNNSRSRLASPPSSSIFRSGDVRGRIHHVDHLGMVEIDDYSIHSISHEYGLLLAEGGCTQVVVGYDSREYSFGLHNAAVVGLLTAGLQVRDIGLATTPLVQWEQNQHLGAAGLMVTASHNPNGWAGLKITPTATTTLEATDFSRLMRGQSTRHGSPSGAKYDLVDVEAAYLADMAARVERVPPRRVVVDGGNAVGGPLLARALEHAGHEVVSINRDLDWTFPAHEPDPDLLTARRQAAKAVGDSKADCAFLVDGDGDRLGVVDAKGRDVSADSVLALLARDICRRVPGAAVVYDVKCSQAVPDVVSSAGGLPIMARTGHMNIKRMMRERAAVFGGERSGHYFDSYRGIGTDDAIYSALRLLEVMGEAGKRLGELIDELPQFHCSPTMHAECPSEFVGEVMEAVLVSSSSYSIREVDRMDGVRVTFDEGWFLVRPSNNMPQLVMVVEGREESDLLVLYRRLRRVLDALPFVDKSWSNDPWAGES